MKNFLYAIILYIFFLIFSSVYAIDRIAVINITNILQKIPERENIEKKLENEFHIKAKSLQLQERELSEKIKILKKKSIKMQENQKKK